jgi:outer membrane lipoprotein-sorting protein
MKGFAMLRVVVFPMVFAAAVGAQTTFPATLTAETAQATRPAALTAESPTDTVLDALDVVGRDLRSFSASVRLAETDAIAQDTVARTGTTIYQATAPGEARMRITFEQRIQDGAVQAQKIEYLLAGGWLVDRNYARKVEVNRQVLRPGEKINLLKLGEGPFPLPIGQPKDEVYKQFEVKKVAAAAGDPQGTVHLELKPKAGTRFERNFSVIDVWVDLGTHFPRRIATSDRNATSLRTTDLENIRVGVEVADEAFKLPEIGPDWQRRDEPFED